MAKILVLLSPKVEEIELITPIDLWRRAGIEVVVVSIDEDRTKTGQQGITIIADKTLSEINVDEYEYIFIPGGAGVREIQKTPLAMRLIRDFIDRDKVICAICAAPTLIKEALLDKKATCYPTMKQELAQWIDEKVVIDGNFITSQGAGTASLFALEVIEHIMGVAKKEEIQTATLF